MRSLIDATVALTGEMVDAFGMPGVIPLFVSVVLFLDWLGWRQERQSRDRAA